MTSEFCLNDKSDVSPHFKQLDTAISKEYGMLLAEDDLLSESLDEINELASEVLASFFEVAKRGHTSEVCEAHYAPVMRKIHSIKGALGMIGLHDLMKSVHGLESFVIDGYQTAEFAPGIVDIMIDYWARFQEVIEAKRLDASELQHFAGCYGCVKSNSYKSVCGRHYSGESHCGEEAKAISHDFANLTLREARAQEQGDTLVVGSAAEVVDVLIKDKKVFKSFKCINEIYTALSASKLKEVKTIFFDVRQAKTNPFLLLSVLSTLRLKAKCCFVVNDKEDLIRFLSDIQFSSAFFILPTSSLDFENEVMKMIGK